MIILITGGVGSVGQDLTASLLEKERRVARGAIPGRCVGVVCRQSRQLFAYRSLFSPSIARQRLEEAIAEYREDLKGASGI